MKKQDNNDEFNIKTSDLKHMFQYFPIQKISLKINIFNNIFSSITYI